MKNYTYILIFIIAAGAGFLIFWQFRGDGELTKEFDLISNTNSSSRAEQSGVEGSQPGDEQVERGEISPQGRNNNLNIMETDGVKHLVPLDKIRSGGPPKDGIPSIDNPKYVSVTEADEFLDDDKLGIAVESGGDWRFYPFQIIVWHEIVNDEFKGESLLVTYCPLCGTGIVFTPTVEGQPTEFGTSGRLYNSNLVMYDRRTDTLWSQQGGRAIVGNLTGEKLEVRAADNVFWEEFKEAHPDGEVLSRDTGAFRDYSRDPYGDYYTDRSIIFPVDNSDDRLHPKTNVYGLGFNNQFKAFPQEAIERDKIVNDEFAGKNILVVEALDGSIRFFDRTISSVIPSEVEVSHNVKDSPGEISPQGRNDNRALTFKIEDSKLVDRETGTEWNFSGEPVRGPLKIEGLKLTRLNPEFGFWFSWVAFNPDTELYD